MTKRPEEEAEASRAAVAVEVQCELSALELQIECSFEGLSGQPLRKQKEMLRQLVKMREQLASGGCELEALRAPLQQLREP